MSIAILGTAEVTARIIGHHAEQAARALEAVTRAADEAKVVADPLTPVKTGYLKSRNQKRMTEKGPRRFVSEFYNDADYAQAIILGHHTRRGTHVTGRDFMTPAFVRGRSVLYDTISR